MKQPRLWTPSLNKLVAPPLTHTWVEIWVSVTKLRLGNYLPTFSLSLLWQLKHSVEMLGKSFSNFKFGDRERRFFFQTKLLVVCAFFYMYICGCLATAIFPSTEHSKCNAQSHPRQDFNFHCTSALHNCWCKWDSGSWGGEGGGERNACWTHPETKLPLCQSLGQTKPSGSGSIEPQTIVVLY